MSKARTNVVALNVATPLPIPSGIVPSKHLRQFSSRIAGNGSGALPGAVTVAAGAVTAIALGTAGTAYSTVSTRVLIVGDGTGAAAHVTVGGGGDITGYVIDSGGAGYTTATAYVVDGPVVVLVGDSIATESPTPANFGASLWYTLVTAVQQANPGRSISFFNRAVGGQTWTTLNGTANANWPGWYSNHSKAWLDYVKEVRPDAVVVALGMNDAENFVFAQMKAAIDKMLAFSQEPDIILATTMTPSSTTADTSYSSFTAQNGRDACAAYVRGYALADGYGLLDFGRQLRLVRDGYDQRVAALRQISSASAALPWTATTQAQSDFSLGLSFAGVTGGWWTGGPQVLTVQLGTLGVNTVTELLIDDSAGFVRITVRDRQPGVGSTNQYQIVTTIARPTGTVVFGVLVQDQRLLVTVNGTVAFDKTIKRFAGIFYPVLSAVTTSISPTLTYCAGEAARYMAHMDDGALWGLTGDGTYQGNGLNHPSALAVATVIAPVVFGADWAHTVFTIGADAVGLTTNGGVGEPDPLCRLHVTKTQMSTDVVPIATANNLLLEDASAAGLTIMTEDGGTCRIMFADASNTQQFQIAYAHTSNIGTITHSGTDVLSMLAAVAYWGVPMRLASYAKASLPSAATAGAGGMIYVTDDVGGATPAFSDGAAWRRVADRNVIS